MKRECSELQVAFWVEPVNVPHTGVLICGHPSRLLMVIALERLLLADLRLSLTDPKQKLNDKLIH